MNAIVAASEHIRARPSVHRQAPADWKR